MDFRHIAIEGVIGAGKTTLATMLAKRFQGAVVLESFKDNAFLPLFYENQERYAFPLEVSFLTNRFQQLKEALSKAGISGNALFADYAFEKSNLFASITLGKEEAYLFQGLYKILEAQITSPDLLIYLDTPLTKIRRQIQQRGRAYEQTISDDYLLKLIAIYEDFVRKTSCPVLVINMTKVDFLEYPAHLSAVCAALKESGWKGKRILEIV